MSETVPTAATGDGDAVEVDKAVADNSLEMTSLQK